MTEAHELSLTACRRACANGPDRWAFPHPTGQTGSPIVPCASRAPRQPASFRERCCKRPEIASIAGGDGNFRTFFVAMLILTGRSCPIATAIPAGKSSGAIWMSLIVLLVGRFLFLFPLAIVALLLLPPSAMTSMKKLERRLGHRRAIRTSAILTTVLASGLFAVVATGLGRDWDNIGMVVAAVSLWAILWAPGIALWAHAARPSDPGHACR